MICPTIGAKNWKTSSAATRPLKTLNPRPLIRGPKHLLQTEAAAKRYGLQPLARVLGMTAAAVPPRIMGIGPVPATQKLLHLLKLGLDDFDILEFNEAFASQALTCTRELGLTDDDPRINPLGGAIALGHPLGMSGARLATTAVYQLQHANNKRALCTMCVGVGQGVALALERA